jgi:hypothetical protein
VPTQFEVEMKTGWEPWEDRSLMLPFPMLLFPGEFAGGLESVGREAMADGLTGAPQADLVEVEVGRGGGGGGNVECNVRVIHYVGRKQDQQSSNRRSRVTIHKRGRQRRHGIYLRRRSTTHSQED